MPSADEEVALYGSADEVVGSAPRARVRRDNLRHGATAVLVRDSYGRIYVHRRTATKDVYPGLLDFAAGGVIQAGEDPSEAAVREASEELGVTGAPLEAVGQWDYRDADTSFRAFGFTTTYDGPIRWQPEEVAWGEWVTVEELLRRLEHDAASFVADSPVLWGARLQRWGADRVVLQGGRNSVTSLVERRWIDRIPQREDVAARLLAETRLLPLIADRLPLAVPRPVVLDAGRDGGPLRVRHPIVVGDEADPARLTGRDGVLVGEFLRALHAAGPEVVRASGVPDADRDAKERPEQLARLREDVLPLVAADLKASGAALLRRLERIGEQCLTHGDLGPEHLLVRDGLVAGVIAWGDARVTDPALDLSRVLHGTSPALANGVERAYGVSPALRDRARDWHRLGPWFRAHRGVLLGDADAVRSGLRAVEERLAR